jgi:adenylate cyclase
MTTAYLEWTNPQGGEQIYVLSADEVLVGRKSDADIILASPGVSCHHARFIKSKEGYCIIDLPNTSGTYVNGRQIQQQELQQGDRIWLGRDRIELRYFTRPDDSAAPLVISETDELRKSMASLASVLPSKSLRHSDLEKIASLLDFQYQSRKAFSAETTFEQILRAALKISGAERGYILLKRQDRFEYVSGLSKRGERLLQSDFRTSQSVARQVARDGKAVYMGEGIATAFAQQKSILELRLRSLACVPLRWLSPESVTPAVNGVL